ncbi:MAG: serine/threonine protein kinase [Bryobacterales bacterium]|nr:serine/threonine protein kinase [Bryobacterales bacterium]
MPDTAQRWRRIETLFHRASAMPAGERTAFLERECGEDTELRRTVDDLMQSDSDSAVLEKAIAVEARHAVDDVQPGEIFGAFRLEELLGRGGMGAVYRAVRIDQEFRQQVAIKLVRSHLRAEDWTRRFLRERQILARLNHPYIARLLDGGSLNGRPYFVMEYVDGVTADTYVQQHSLSVRDRIGLFQKVCQAVSYAHGQLVVHRDIKPQNILVQAGGNPKLLDFGIAKPLEEDEDGALTNASQRVLTPQYAAPEQVLGQPITTATDVYALGALLYALLTSHAPFDTSGLSGFALEKAICDQDPPPPGTLVKLDPDIDAIVARAMRKEPAQRYSSVAALEADLARWLGGYPVEASRGNWQYRARKFLLRRAGAVVAATLVAGSVAAGFASTRIQQQKAERRLEEVRELANRFLFEFHDSIAALPGATQSRQMVVARAIQYLDRLAAETGGDRRLEADLAAGYERIRDIQYGYDFGHLNDVEGAVASAQRAVNLRGKLLAASPKDPATLAAAAKANLGVANLLAETGASLDQAKTYLAEAQRLFAAGARIQPDTLAQLRNDSAVATAAAAIENAAGNGDAAVKAARRAVALQQKAYDTSRDAADVPRLLNSVQMLGDALLLGANLPMDALAEYQRGLQILPLLPAGVPQEMQRSQFVARIGISYAIAGRHKEALPYRRQALELAEVIAARDPKNALTARDLAIACLNAAQNEFKVGSKAEAVRLARRMVVMFEVAMQQSGGSGQSRTDYAAALEDLADYLVRTEGRAEPETLLQKAIALREEIVRQDPQRGVYQSHLAHAWTQFGDCYARWGEPGKAEAMYRKALAAYEKLERDKRINGLDRSDWQRTKENLAKLDTKKK